MIKTEIFLVHRNKSSANLEKLIHWLKVQDSQCSTKILVLRSINFFDPMLKFESNRAH